MDRHNASGILSFYVTLTRPSCAVHDALRASRAVIDSRTPVKDASGASRCSASSATRIRVLSRSRKDVPLPPLASSFALVSRRMRSTRSRNRASEWRSGPRRTRTGLRDTSGGVLDRSRFLVGDGVIGIQLPSVDPLERRAAIAIRAACARPLGGSSSALEPPSSITSRDNGDLRI